MMSFLTKLQNIADTRQEGIRKENRIVPVDDLRMILEHFVRLDKENRTDYHEAKQLRGQLTAANARVAEQQKPSYKAEFDCVYEKLKAEERLSAHYKQKVEQAEAQNKRLRNCGNCDKWRGCWGNPEEVPGMEICYRWENAKNGFVQDAILAENKRMREALERCGLCRDYSHEKVKCYHDYEGHRPPQATCDHPEAGFKLVDWAALEEKP